jgi:hypothetical protein
VPAVLPANGCFATRLATRHGLLSASDAGAGLLSLGTVTVHPSPDHRMIGFQAAFFQQLLNIPQRQRISKVPADCAEPLR